MNLDVAFALRRAVARGGYDLVLANGSATLRYLATVGRLATSRRRLGYVAIGDPSYWAKTAGSRRRMSLLLRSVGWVLAVSQATAEQVAAIGGPGVEVEVVLGGVPPAFLEIDRPPRRGPLNAVVIGSLTREKDPEAAVEVMAAAGADFRLRFVGTGPLGDEVRAAARRLGIADRVELAGATSDVTSHLAWAHLLLLTSRTEGLPGVVLEAAAAGLPTLGFDVGGTSEVVADGTTGRVVAAGDRAALAAAVSEVAADDAVRLGWGANARAMVRERYLLEHAAERYDRALRRRLSPPGE